MTKSSKSSKHSTSISELPDLQSSTLDNGAAAHSLKESKTTTSLVKKNPINPGSILITIFPVIVSLSAIAIAYLIFQKLKKKDSELKKLDKKLVDLVKSNESFTEKLSKTDSLELEDYIKAQSEFNVNVGKKVNILDGGLGELNATLKSLHEKLADRFAAASPTGVPKPSSVINIVPSAGPPVKQPTQREPLPTSINTSHPINNTQNDVSRPKATVNKKELVNNQENLIPQKNEKKVVTLEESVVVEDDDSDEEEVEV